MKIIHAQHAATGKLYGVDFLDGIGHTDDPELAEKFRRKGHKIAQEVEYEPDETVELEAVALDDTSEVEQAD